jgi:hypothetical protein
MIMNDDTLILYYYDDGLSDDERAAVEAAFEEDAALGERYRVLCSELEQLSEQPTMAAPPQATARWHRSIENAAAERGGHRSRHRVRRFPWLSLAGPLAAALVAGIAIGLYLGAHDTPAPTIAEPGNTVAGDDRPGVQAVPVAFTRGLEFHLRRSRQEITHLNGEPDRRLLILDIVRQNRVFERVAEDNEAEDVARVLRAFEPVLLRLADERTSAADAAALRSRLAFELDVVLTKMQRRDSDQTDSI